MCREVRNGLQWSLTHPGPYSSQAFANQVNIQQMDLPLASSVPWAPFSLMWAVQLASHVAEVFLPNIRELLPSKTVKPEVSTYLPFLNLHSLLSSTGASEDVIPPKSRLPLWQGFSSPQPPRPFTHEWATMSRFYKQIPGLPSLLLLYFSGLATPHQSPPESLFLASPKGGPSQPQLVP